MLTTARSVLRRPPNLCAILKKCPSNQPNCGPQLG